MCSAEDDLDDARREIKTLRKELDEKDARIELLEGQVDAMQATKTHGVIPRHGPPMIDSREAARIISTLRASASLRE